MTARGPSLRVSPPEGAGPVPPTAVLLRPAKQATPQIPDTKPHTRQARAPASTEHFCVLEVLLTHRKFKVSRPHQTGSRHPAVQCPHCVPRKPRRSFAAVTLSSCQHCLVLTGLTHTGGHIPACPGDTGTLSLAWHYRAALTQGL